MPFFAQYNQISATYPDQILTGSALFGGANYWNTDTIVYVQTLSEGKYSVLSQPPTVILRDMF